MEAFEPPFMISFQNAMIFLVVALIVLHVVFLLFWKLSKLGLKILDYIWLFIAVIAVTGVVSTARQQYAKYYLKESEGRLANAADQVKSALLSGELFNCQHFIRDTNLPPQEFEAHKRKEATCAWYRNALQKFEESGIGRESVKIEFFGNPPPEKDGDWVHFTEMLNRHNKAVEGIQSWSIKAEKNEWEHFWPMLAPWLLIGALALRITKVTVEIQHERGDEDAFDGTNKRDSNEIGKSLIEKWKDPERHLNGICRDFDECGIDYAIIGSLAARCHNYLRAGDDIDVLVSRESYPNIEKFLIGHGYSYRPGSERHLYLEFLGGRTPLDIYVEGERRDDGVPLPNPKASRIKALGRWYVSLPLLIALKIRSDDLTDVIQMVEANGLVEDFADSLEPDVREKFLEMLEGSERPG